jgi:eukaryotic-like serine/threonine-protein kinase
MISSNMDPKRWQQVKSVLGEVLGQPAEKRQQFLGELQCKDDELFREVVSLLSLEDRAEGFEESPLSEFSRNGETIPVGRQIGNYKITGELGAGGLGAVYLAERGDGVFEHKVALKLIKRGMDSDAILRRFHTERQIPANLNHPNIARLLDGGTTQEGYLTSSWSTSKVFRLTNIAINRNSQQRGA